MEAKLEKLIYVLLTFIFFINFAYSQQKDSLIQLYPGIGDTLDQFDRNYFELFQNIEGFKHAVFYIRNNQRLVSKVTYYENGKTNDTTFIQLLSALDNARKMIEEIEKENEKKYKSPREFFFEAKNGSEYICEIEMFSKTMIYCNTSNNSKFKFDHSNIEALTLVGETNTWSCMGYGALVGLGVGLIGAIASSQGEDSGGFGSGAQYVIGIPLITVVGGIFGLIFGLASSSGDELLPIDYQEDLLQLKDNAKYYFRYDESVEKEYIEID